MKDERLQSSMESESEDKWLPIQILNTVYSTPNLTEEVQVEIMKVRLLYGNDAKFSDGEYPGPVFDPQIRHILLRTNNFLPALI